MVLFLKRIPLLCRLLTLKTFSIKLLVIFVPVKVLVVVVLPLPTTIPKVKPPVVDRLIRLPSIILLRLSPAISPLLITNAPDETTVPLALPSMIQLRMILAEDPSSRRITLALMAVLVFLNVSVFAPDKDCPLIVILSAPFSIIKEVSRLPDTIILPCGLIKIV